VILAQPHPFAYAEPHPEARRPDAPHPPHPNCSFFAVCGSLQLTPVPPGTEVELAQIPPVPQRFSCSGCDLSRTIGRNMPALMTRQCHTVIYSRDDSGRAWARIWFPRPRTRDGRARSAAPRAPARRSRGGPPPGLPGGQLPHRCLACSLISRFGQTHSMPKLVSPAAFIQQRIRHAYRRQRPTPRPSRMAKSRHQSQLGVDGLDVAHAGSISTSCVGRPCVVIMAI
jgi:hypothetical protein